MARKFTKFVYMDDESEIKRIIHEYHPDIRFIKLSYVRDDRVIDLETNQVYIDTAPGMEPKNTLSIYRRGGEVATDNLKNAIWENGRILGKCVHVDFGKDTLEISIQDVVFANLESRYFSWPNLEVQDLCEALGYIDGCEKMSKDMIMLRKYYPDHGPSKLAKVWLLIEEYDLFDLVGEYSKLFDIGAQMYLTDDLDFFNAAKLPKELLFRLTDFYLTNRDDQSFIRTFQTEGYLWKFLEQLPWDCKDAILSNAISEKFDIVTIAGPLCYRSKALLEYINENKEFFIQYINTVRVRDSEDILSAYFREVEDLKSYGMELNINNRNNLKIAKKADDMGVSVHDFFELVNGINTKEGILKYISIG